MPGPVFTFRPNGTTDSSLNLFTDFDDLYAACADLRSAGLPFTVFFDDPRECDIPTTVTYNLGGRATLMGDTQDMVVVLGDGAALKGFNRVTGRINVQAQLSGGAPPVQLPDATQMLVDGGAILSTAGSVPLIELAVGSLKVILDNGKIVRGDSEVLKLGASCYVEIFGSRGASIDDDSVEGVSTAQLNIWALDTGTALGATHANFEGIYEVYTTWTRQLAMFGARTVSLTSGTYYASLDGGDCAIHGEHSVWRAPQGPRTLLLAAQIWNSVAGSAPSGHKLVVDVMRNGTAVSGLHLELDPSDTTSHTLEIDDADDVFSSPDDVIEVRVVHTSLTTTPRGLFIALMGV